MPHLLSPSSANTASRELYERITYSWGDYRQPEESCARGAFAEPPALKKKRDAALKGYDHLRPPFEKFWDRNAMLPPDVLAQFDAASTSRGSPAPAQTTPDFVDGEAEHDE